MSNNWEDICQGVQEIRLFLILDESMNSWLGLGIPNTSLNHYNPIIDQCGKIIPFLNRGMFGH